MRSENSFSGINGSSISEELDCQYLLANRTDGVSCEQARQLASLNEAEQRCMHSYWARGGTLIEGPHCEVEFDKYLCWGPVEANRTINQPCPLKLVDASVFAFRICNPDGRWKYGNWTNYDECLTTASPLPPREIWTPSPFPTISAQQEYMAFVLFNIYFFGSIISCVLLCLTLFVFSYFKTLHCNRISIHKNLVVSFIVRCVLYIINSEPFVTNRLSTGYTYRDVDWLCKILTALLQYAVIANIFWMFVEGLFLHNRVAVSVFSTEAPFMIFYAVGWGLPALIVIIWVICISTLEDFSKRCWTGHFSTPYKWIITVPILLALIINAIFLVNIIRILITKLRANNTVETIQVKKAVKATAVLFPLLGMTNVLFFIEPQDSVESEMAYRVINAVLQSSQGIFVSVIYCFMNSEVRAAITKKWQRYKSQRMGSNRGRRRSSTGRTSMAFLSSTTDSRKSSNPRDRVNMQVTSIINNAPVSSKDYNNVPTQGWNLA